MTLAKEALTSRSADGCTRSAGGIEAIHSRMYVAELRLLELETPSSCGPRDQSYQGSRFRRHPDIS